MNHKETLQVFSWHAFKSNKPIAEYGQLIKDILRYARGLPLSLIVLGSDTKGRSIND